LLVNKLYYIKGNLEKKDKLFEIQLSIKTISFQLIKEV
jgi:hypothetical protein